MIKTAALIQAESLKRSDIDTLFDINMDVVSLFHIMIMDFLPFPSSRMHIQINEEKKTIHVIKTNVTEILECENNIVDNNANR